MKQGFTLIELLVVVLIIGILSAVALPEYTLAVERSRSTEALVNGKAITDSVQRYLQQYPGDSVISPQQIADVALAGGTSTTWNANNKYETPNFTYQIVTNGVKATRNKTDGGTHIYEITFIYNPTSNRVNVSCTNGIGYNRICNAIDKLYGNYSAS